VHLDAYARIDGVEVVAVCDLDAVRRDAAAARTGAASFATLSAAPAIGAAPGRPVARSDGRPAPPRSSGSSGGDGRSKHAIAGK
jgi:hypothetical protein